MTEDSRPPFEEPSAEALPGLVEALLFVADGPTAEPALARVLGVAPRALREALDAVAERLAGHGVQLLRGPEGVQLVTAPEAAAAVEHFLGLESGRRLSTAALETLAVVAYRQPVTRAAIEAIRGTSSDAVLATLRARGLIVRVGRADSPGRPALYGTTQRFLEHFGLGQAGDLPGLDELAERLGLETSEGAASVVDAAAADLADSDLGAAGVQAGMPFEGLPAGGLSSPLGERMYARYAGHVTLADRDRPGAGRPRGGGPASTAPALPRAGAPLPEAPRAMPPGPPSPTP